MDKKRGAAEPINPADNKKAKHGKATDDKNIGDPKFCETCEMWVRPEQWEKHKQGPKHLRHWTEKYGYKNL